MGEQNASRINGDEYQQLYSWYLILRLKLPEEQVRKVILENGEAGLVDDVTVHHEIGTNLADQFYQLKYHQDRGQTYSAEKLIATSGGSKSLLQKFWLTWQKLRKAEPSRAIELYLVSNWGWDAKEKSERWIDADNSHIRTEVFMAKMDEVIEKIRQQWQQHLNINDQDFFDFMSCLYFNLEQSSRHLRNDAIAERMKQLRLKTDITTLTAISKIVHTWIGTKEHDIFLSTLDATLLKYNLYLPAEQENCISICLEGYEHRMYDSKIDHTLNWSPYFLDRGHLKGHQLHDPADWNGKLLSELYDLKTNIKEKSACRLIKARGQAQLSPWFAFGYVFSSVAGYTLATEQNGQVWRTDAPADTQFQLITNNKGGMLSMEGETLDGEGETVAIGISIKGSWGVLDNDVKKYLRKRTEKVAALLLLRPETDSLSSAGEAVALSNLVKNYASAFVKHWGAEKLLLFYIGPSSGACFIGHRLNKVSPAIQIMEYQNPGYDPSFLLL